MTEKKQIEDVLREEGVFVGTTAGSSMYPMLKNRRDTIIIRPYEGRLKKYDVPLYKRGDKYILHRIIKVLPDSYIIRGDNCIRKEYGITDGQILGVLDGFYRKGKEVDMEGAAYRMYVRVWCALFPLRFVCQRLRFLLSLTLKNVRMHLSIQKGKQEGKS